MYREDKRNPAVRSMIFPARKSFPTLRLLQLEKKGLTKNDGRHPKVTEALDDLGG